MDFGHQEDQETLGALAARLIENGRALVKAELALFRTDFYRRISRARIGVLALLVGAIMGQAAAVTFLVTLSFVLTPWIGRLGGAAVSVLLGIGLAVFLIKFGVRKLMLVVEDPDDDEDDAEFATGERMSQIDGLFERMRQRSREARNELSETMGEAQARLHPQALIADLTEMIIDRAQAMSHQAVDAVRRRPGLTTAAVAAVILLAIRPPIHRIARNLTKAALRNKKSFSSGRRRNSAARDDEETSA
ncbi:MAG: phage holin family protein [Pseudomonadota bacterium]